MNELKVVANMAGNTVMGNHANMDRALELLSAAKSAGATAVRFDVIKVDEFHSEPDVRDNMRKFEIEWEMLFYLGQTAMQMGLEFQCTPHYIDALNLIESLGCAIHITSGDITNIPLLTTIGNDNSHKFSNISLATCAATNEEIAFALELLTGYEDGGGLVTLVHTTAPMCGASGLNLHRIAELQADFFPSEVGYADTNVMPTVAAAVALYDVDHIEVNFDLEDGLGVDNLTSYTPSELAGMIDNFQVLRLARSCGCSTFPITDLIVKHSERRNPKTWLRPAGVLNE